MVDQLREFEASYDRAVDLPPNAQFAVVSAMKHCRVFRTVVPRSFMDVDGRPGYVQLVTDAEKTRRMLQDQIDQLAEKLRDADATLEAYSNSVADHPDLFDAWPRTQYRDVQAASE